MISDVDEYKPGELAIEYPTIPNSRRVLILKKLTEDEILQYRAFREKRYDSKGAYYYRVLTPQGKITVLLLIKNWADFIRQKQQNDKTR